MLHDAAFRGLSLPAILAGGGGEGLQRFGQLCQAVVNAGNLCLGVPETLEVPVEPLPRGGHGTFQVGDPVRQRRTCRGNRSQGTQVRNPTTPAPQSPPAFRDAPLCSHGSAVCNVVTKQATRDRFVFSPGHGKSSGPAPTNGTHRAECSLAQVARRALVIQAAATLSQHPHEAEPCTVVQSSLRIAPAPAPVAVTHVGATPSTLERCERARA